MIKVLILVVAVYSISVAMSGEDMVNQYGCMECHGIKKGKTAPAFTDVAKSAQKERIMKSIRNGSQGKYKKYTQNIMPEFDYFTDTELKNIAKWIKSLENEK